MEMGERIRLKRKELGMTQSELAQKLGLKDSAIAKYENGRVSNIKRSTIQKMSEIFNCSPTYLLGIEEPQSSSVSASDFVLEGRHADVDYCIHTEQGDLLIEKEEIELLRAYRESHMQEAIKKLLGL